MKREALGIGAFRGTYYLNCKPHFKVQTHFFFGRWFILRFPCVLGVIYIGKISTLLSLKFISSNIYCANIAGDCHFAPKKRIWRKISTAWDYKKSGPTVILSPRLSTAYLEILIRSFWKYFVFFFLGCSVSAEIPYLNLINFILRQTSHSLFFFLFFFSFLFIYISSEFSGFGYLGGYPLSYPSLSWNPC